MASPPAPETIGKYRVLARIGRGGMGTVLKAHDPILDRVVALKVISADVDVTDELRARFFREAQAGARLSHPNIVTVYDLAEAEGRRVIVMEFLDGQELRQIITERRPLGLDEKLGIMIQLCDGLAYAHRHGVVHRDIKPGNIFVLRNGTAKILDFGVARIVAADAGLTRTGLIMGTLRYIAPEQARGRGDQRSDIFSTGAVCYELLAYRPAFPGDDPMEILEAIRSHDPPRLDEIDPSIPAELAALVARALDKDPERRIQDLAAMSDELQSIRRRLLATLDGARQRLRSRLDDVARLQAALGERLGASLDEETVPIPREGGLATLAALEQNAEERIERLNAVLAASARLQATFERGTAALATGRLDDAIAALERVVHEVPEHARARAALDEARERLDGERRAAEEEAAGRARASRGAMDLARRAAEDVAAPGLAADTWHAANERAANGEAALARRDHAAAAQHFDAACVLYRQATSDAQAIRSEHAQAAANAAARDVVRLREAAVDADAERYAPEAWRAAVDDETRGGAALEHGDVADAAVSLASARDAYTRAAEAARRERARHERDAANRARVETDRARETAQLADAGTLAASTWTGAEDLRAQGEALLTRGASREAESRFHEATALYTSASEHARAAVQVRRQRAAEAARARLEQRRARAAEAGARRDGATLWADADGVAARGRAAADAGDFVDAAAAFDRAAEMFADAEAAAREASRRRAATAEQAAPEKTVAIDVTEVRRPVDAPPAASAPVRASRSSMRRHVAVAAVVVCVTALAVGGRWYVGREAPPTTPTPSPGPAPAPVVGQRQSATDAQRAEIESLRARLTDLRQAAEKSAGAASASTITAARDREAHGTAALGRSQLDEALTAFREAEAQYRRALEAPPATAIEREGDDDKTLARARSAATAAREAATRSGASALAGDAFDSAERRWTAGQSDVASRNLAAATRSFVDAERLYRDADRVARRRQTLRRDAEAGRDRARAAGADFLAKDLFDAGSAKLADAQRLAAARDWPAAERVFGEAVALYGDAQRRLGDIEKVRVEAEKAKERREQARLAGAEGLAKEYFDAAAARHVEADRLARGPDVTAAIPVYQDAARRYADAEKRVQAIRR